LSFPDYLFFRVNPGIGKTNSETVSNVLGGPNAKFGIEPSKIVSAIKEAKEYGMKNYGIHVMTGSNVLDDTYFYELTKTIVEIIKEHSLEPTQLNLGGGIGIPYSDEQKEIHLGKVVDNIKRGLGDLKVRVIMENGRYLTGPSGFLFTKVQVIKESFGKKYLGVNACMSNLMRPGMYGAYHNIVNFSRADLEELAEETYQIVGNLCENNDWFGKDRVLPKTSVGDILVITDAGAHSHSMGFQYNGKLRSGEYLMDGEGIKKIRRKETLEDYLKTIV
jgi:diaminopimelate decarboxylase